MNVDEIAVCSSGIVSGLTKKTTWDEAVSLLTTSLGMVLSEAPDGENVTKIKNEISNFIAKEIIHESDKKLIFHIAINRDNSDDAIVLSFPGKDNRTDKQQ